MTSADEDDDEDERPYRTRLFMALAGIAATIIALHLFTSDASIPKEVSTKVAKNYEILLGHLDQATDKAGLLKKLRNSNRLRDWYDELKSTTFEDFRARHINDTSATHQRTYKQFLKYLDSAQNMEGLRSVLKSDKDMRHWFNQLQRYTGLPGLHRSHDKIRHSLGMPAAVRVDAVADAAVNCGQVAEETVSDLVSKLVDSLSLDHLKQSLSTSVAAKIKAMAETIEGR